MDGCCRGPGTDRKGNGIRRLNAAKLRTMNSDPKKLLKKHQALVQSDGLKVTSHVQREVDDWFLNTLMLEGYDVPFKYKRNKKYKDLKGQRVNLTYYPSSETVAGMEFEIMKVVRIKIS